MVMYVLRPVASGSFDINVNNKRGWRLPVWCGIAVALCLGWLAPAMMQAQTTAYFSGTTTTLPSGSGFNEVVGVAVDRSGNIFVADTGHSAVDEIVAVNGSIPANPAILTLGSGFNQPDGIAV